MVPPMCSKICIVRCRVSHSSAYAFQRSASPMTVCGSELPYPYLTYTLIRKGVRPLLLMTDYTPDMTANIWLMHMGNGLIALLRNITNINQCIRKVSMHSDIT